MTAPSLPSLLLLPPAPHPADRASLSAAYRPSLKSAIAALRDSDADGSVLIVALASPILQGSFRRQKALSWPEAQSLLAGVYSVISAVCEKLRVQAVVNGGKGSVDARVVLVDHDLSKKPPADFKPAIETNSTVIVDLATFVSAYHPWDKIFSVDSEAGHQLLSTYLSMYEGIQVLKQEQLIAVEGGLTLNIGPPAVQQPSSPTPSYDVVCLGGTFDHLHPGHKLLLTAAVLLLKVPEEGTSQSCRFIIGITGDELLKNKKYAEFVQSWDERALYVIEFLASLLQLQKGGWEAGESGKLEKKDGDIAAYFRGDTIAIQCVRIQDPFGPTITTERMDALIVSGETRSGGSAVNDRRKQLGWQPMEIYEVDVLDAEDVSDSSSAKSEDFSSKISSTEIRKRKAESRM
ncbi:hypothetical protein BX600DRAFT_506188 [Xylariales sp. PMI_506]|nr:hypothetical protein BX600DRAFT_506188 [Xylariales sp. PMI_506]